MSASKRGANWTTQEDEALCTAWLNTSQDASVGINQRATTLYDRVYENFQEICTENQVPGNPELRAPSGIKARWHHISKMVSKFAGCLAQIENRCQSGASPEDMVKQAIALFATMEKTAFALMHCYIILQSAPKWQQYHNVKIEHNQGYCSGVCQSCSYTISEFYQYSEKVRQNQEVLNGNVTNCDPTIDSKDALEIVKVEPLSDSVLPETIEYGCESKDEVSIEKELLSVDSKITLESIKVETPSDFGLLDSTEDACKSKDEVSEEEEEEVISSCDDGSYEPPPKKSQTKRKLDNLETDEPMKNSKQTLTQKHHERMKEDQLLNKYFSMICDLCGASTATFTELQRHFRKEHKRRDTYIRCCNKKLYHRGTILDHIDFHVNPDVFRCEVCGCKYKTKNSLNAHMLSKHPSDGPFKCYLCPQSFAQKEALAKHLKLHVKVKCPKCNKMLAANSLKNHLTNQHSGENRSMVCDTCGKEFLTKYYFDRHMKEHMGIEEQRIQCEICHSWLKGKHNYRGHMNTVHADSDREFQCDICLNKYPYSRALKQHKLRTHAEPKHECEFCGRKFKVAISLKHRTIHTGEEIQRLQCEICKRKLKDEQSLRVHMDTAHIDGNQEVQCDICLQKYPHSRALQSHKKTHAEPKHECEFCGKKFKSAISLKEHSTTHTGEVLYSCEYCGISKNSRQNFQHHIKRHHPTEMAQKKLIAT